MCACDAFSLTTALFQLPLIPLKLGVSIPFRLFVPNINLMLLILGAVVVAGGGDQCVPGDKDHFTMFFF